MSSFTQAPPSLADQAARKPRLVDGPLALTFLAEFASLTSFLLLVSVLPMLVAAGGASSAAAGLITGALLAGTVIAEAAATFAIGRLGYRAALDHYPGAGNACPVVTVPSGMTGAGTGVRQMLAGRGR